MKPFFTPASAVYIHIPFCTNKCHYCDFNSYVLKGQPVTEYLDALEREMAMTVERFPAGRVETVFVGGGTPTVLLPDQMERFLGLVQTYFPDRTDRFEFTMEANPGTTDAEKLAVMKAGGVNRISFGVQSFDPELLKRIGRIHSVDDVYESIENAKRIGFSNLSIDLMLGLPKQTVGMMSDSLDKALELDLQHYSIYALKVEENTLFHKLYQRNELPLPEEEEELSMYLMTMNKLKQAGYAQYEISNFAIPGFESRHNLMYWHNRSYYGLGAGAHGYMEGVRHINVKGIQPYIDATRQGLPILEANEVSRGEAMEDFMMVGLRVLSGVSEDDFADQFGESLMEVFGPVINRLTEQGLLEADEGRVRLSDKGILLGNEVFAEFIGILS
ncbi:radical SAM family heme chaperone HemW [Paenibacillus sp. 32O-W]|uniref:radical SAM family heme chaperone HemW n=1 Tax=Paenibacillus sp. 32O-W TaxID=1695218 RepID=UPI0011A0CEDB|nr:radical SAM family heme chaperone HemW [Paenibacillus sp. 32O-W]